LLNEGKKVRAGR